MIPRCNWPGGCRTILRQGNKTGICGAHQKMLDEEEIMRKEGFARRKGVEEARTARYVTEEAVPVKRVIEATDFFYGASGERVGEELSFARQVAIFLLKQDFDMSFDSISCNLKCERAVVQRSYHRIRSLANSSPDLKRNLSQIRVQYQAAA